MRLTLLPTLNTYVLILGRDDIDRKFVSDALDEPFTLAEFITANIEDPMCPEWVAEMVAMKRGKSMAIGGGAGVLSVITLA